MRPAPRKARAGFTLIEILVVVIIIGLLAAISQANFMAAQDKARASNLVSDLKTISVGLEGFSSDNSGHYPAIDKLFNGDPGPATDRGLLVNKYLPGDRWPPSPWNNRATQTANLVSPHSPILTAVGYLTQPPPANSLPKVGDRTVSLISPSTTPGHRPVVATDFDDHAYGAIYYDYSKDDSVWVLFGVGKDHNNAILAADRANGGS